ncbi:MAG: tail-specific protease, partial [Candidatus Competibacter sp.]|nr:tail-specific protease [Candidatus Competibacter sp.]
MHNVRILKSLILLPLALMLSMTGVSAKPDEPVTDTAIRTLAPTTRQASLDQTIAELLSRHHYRQSKLDDRLSALVLTAYLDDIDFSRAYFLASDIAGFEKYR